MSMNNLVGDRTPKKKQVLEDHQGQEMDPLTTSVSRFSQILTASPGKTLRNLVFLIQTDRDLAPSSKTCLSSWIVHGFFRKKQTWTLRGCPAMGVSAHFSHGKRMLHPGLRPLTSNAAICVDHQRAQLIHLDLQEHWKKGRKGQKTEERN